jgi:purine nucleosidase
VQSLLIDTDPGVDDALALLMALSDPAVEVIALTVAAGNVGLAHTVPNALRVLELAGSAAPVFAGCATPLLHPAADAAFVHGRDGLGDAGLPAPSRAAESEHAALAMLRLSRETPGALTFVMLGPLTNLALALRLDPQLPQRVARLVVMGGAVTGRGNIERIPVEFNIGFDPEAAHIVFSSWPRVELIDWEATLAHAIAFERFAGWLTAGDHRARWYDAASRKTRKFMADTPHRGQWVAADALAMAVAIEPQGVWDAMERPLAIELAGTLTRGATVVDWDRRSGAADNARIVRRFDPARFEALVARALGAA